MPFNGFQCVVTGQPVAVADCIAHAVSEGGQLAELGCPFTPAILRGIAKTLEDQPMPNGALRVTQLLGCAKRVQWQRDHPYPMDPRDAYNLFRGQIGHTIVESYHGSEILLSEERLSAEIAGVTVTGQPDAVVDTEHRHLDDYKTTKRIPREPYEHHIAQVNVYAWLLHKAKGVEIKTASIVYLDMGGVAHLAVPIWSRRKTEKFLRERIASWQQGATTPSAWECKSCPLNEECADVATPSRARR